MPARCLRAKRERSRHRGTDRAVGAAVVLAVTVALLLAGFSGPSVELRLPGPAGWLHIGVVLIVATVFLVWFLSAGAKQESPNGSGSKTNNAARIGVYKTR
jgi:protein-S-isoprenylcysteine O-methyltransferase Ste14